MENPWAKWGTQGQVSCLCSYKAAFRSYGFFFMLLFPGHLCHFFITTVSGVKQHLWGIDAVQLMLAVCAL